MVRLLRDGIEVGVGGESNPIEEGIVSVSCVCRWAEFTPKVEGGMVWAVREMAGMAGTAPSRGTS